MNKFRGVKRVLWITMGLNLVAAGVKLAVGNWTGSLSLTASGVDSVFDSASNVIGLVGVFFAARPADESHPYGYRKADTMAGMIISSLLFVTTWQLVTSAVARLQNPSLIRPVVNVWSFGTLAFSVVLNLGVARYEMQAGRRLHSDTLVADAKNSRADVFASLAVMGGLVATKLGFTLADPILALCVALLVMKVGVDIIRESSRTLMDQAALPVEQLRAIVRSVPGVLSCHKLRSRRDSGAVFVDLHIQVDPVNRADDAHAIAHEVQYRLREQYPEIQDVTIHEEPARPESAPGVHEEVASEIRIVASGLDLGVHNVWVYESGGQFYADAHTEVDGTISLRDAHALVSRLEGEACARVPGLVELTAHVEPRRTTAHAPVLQSDENSVTQAVVEVADEVLGRDACHSVHVRRVDLGCAVSMHCTFPGEISVTEAHHACDHLEGELRHKVPGLKRVVIHAEPA